MAINIQKFIPRGKNNRISCSELSKKTGIDSRSLQKLIADARKQGAVICSCLDSNKGGYYLPDSPEEVVQYVLTERSRIRSAMDALRSAEEYVNNIWNMTS